MEFFPFFFLSLLLAPKFRKALTPKKRQAQVVKSDLLVKTWLKEYKWENLLNLINTLLGIRSFCRALVDVRRNVDLGF